ncbi:DUF4157 domain-containing protein [Streptomyces sp. NPDC059002]|uniref:eCIS core domain-containing protein n=1 Tax=Streptomyces sp. NPDC059002 TaxID=3346690 RepID=UPI0036BD901C
MAAPGVLKGDRVTSRHPHNDPSQKSDHQPRALARRATTPGRAAAPTGLMALQAGAGNAAVVQMLRQAGHAWVQPAQHQHGAGCGHQQAEQPAVQRSAVHDVLRTPGKPMDDATRTDMESRLGADFSDVRIHNDSAARASAAEVGALAYTSGSHVIIGDGGSDKHTLAHELTHVIQQRQGPVAGTDNGSGLKVSDPSDRFEREAESHATRAMAGTVAASEAADATPGAPVSATAAVQRQSVVSGNLLVKRGRHDFRNDLCQAMNLAPNQARCHTVSYELMSEGVIRAVNAALAAANSDNLGELWGLVDAVFPTAGNLPAIHQNHPNAVALQRICTDEFNKAYVALNDLNNLLTLPARNVQVLNLCNTYANNLIKALNNSPANLRPGASNTNSSIQGALDLTPVGPPQLLRQNTPIVDTNQTYDENGYRHTPLAVATDVLRVAPMHEEQVWNLITRTAIPQVHLFSSGAQLQTSDVPNMNSGTMTQNAPRPVAIQVPGSNPPVYFLFQP